VSISAINSNLPMIEKNKEQRTKNKVKSKLTSFLTTNYQLLTTSSGFTLIELLIVMAVLGVLASVVIVQIGPASQQRARDTIRRNDIKQYQTALEIYANKSDGDYPAVGAMPCTDLGLSGSLCKEDPQGGSYPYFSDGSVYVIGATLEYRPGGTQMYFVACSNGLSDDSTAAATDTTCPL